MRNLYNYVFDEPRKKTINEANVNPERIVGKDVKKNGTGDQLKIENTKELYDIFGEEALTKIYDYIITH